MNYQADSVKLHNKQSAKRLIALVICVLFIVGSLLSAAFIFTHINHIHDHNRINGSCTTCAHLTTAGNVFNVLSIALASAMFVLGCCSAINSILRSVSFNADYITLVHLKVRLNY